MKALTLTQPWATLVAIDAKAIETRSWWTSYRGPLAIHATKAYPLSARITAECHIPTRDTIRGKVLPLGAIVATCRLVDCQQVRSPLDMPDYPERTFGDLIALVHSELSEALEAYREFGDTKSHREMHISPSIFEGVPYELGDVVIRVADMAEWYGWELSSDGAAPTQTSFGGWIAFVHYHLSQAYGERSHYREQYLNNVLVVVYRMAAHYGIDLDAAIEAKMEYNRSRPYRHGGKVL